ncbi:ATP-binding protein [Allorhodopirellula heiligendammensis]|nr:ATP-binding protein [Allorhodopirellula heiligendammensis]
MHTWLDMDPRTNPFAPGAGTPPPELAGREHLLEKASIAVDRLAGKLNSRGMVFYGLRGVGKTVLLQQMRLNASADGYVTVPMEAPENRSLPSILLPALRATVIKNSTGAAAKAKFRDLLGVLASFANAVKAKYDDVEVVLDVAPTAGIADSGDLESDLCSLFSELGRIAADQATVVAIYIDELQYVSELELAALISALHQISQERLPVTLFAAGLPQLLGQLGKAKSYAERLFDFQEIGSLERAAAADALTIPARQQSVEFDSRALDHILDETKCYPYFIQEWGQHAWQIAPTSPITLVDAQATTESAIAHLDSSFFRVRFDRLTPQEKRYMRAMAELGPGAHRSGDVAEVLSRSVQSLGPCRSSLIRKGMAYSASHGDIAFTVPLFEGFMKRTMDLVID